MEISTHSNVYSSEEIRHCAGQVSCLKTYLRKKSGHQHKETIIDCVVSVYFVMPTVQGKSILPVNTSIQVIPFNKMHYI